MSGESQKIDGGKFDLLVLSSIEVNEDGGGGEEGKQEVLQNLNQSATCFRGNGHCASKGVSLNILILFLNFCIIQF